MNGAQIHLLINHIPIVGLFFGVILLIFGLMQKQAVLQKAAMLTFVLMALLVVPVNQSGEAAEEVLESMEISQERHSYIHEHEESAGFAMWFLLGLGVVSLVALTTEKNKSLSGALKWVLLIGSILVFLLVARVGHLGGEISHPEIRSDFIAPK